MTDSISLREAAVADAAEIARLLTQLGHTTTAAEVRGRWRAWHAEGHQAWVAARPDGSLAGLIQTAKMRVLHRPKPVGRVSSLVIDEPDRGAGIGTALLAIVESKLRDYGCGLVEVTSNDRLVEAHEFYRRRAYRRTSIRLAKDVSERATPTTTNGPA
ncbi:MAG: GNAT family N-acetyltransferase [Planctomycetota bacterium]